MKQDLFRKIYVLAERSYHRFHDMMRIRLRKMTLSQTASPSHGIQLGDDGIVMDLFIV